jgi:hypothetical protein
MKGNNMDWTQVLTIVGANIGIFLWLRSESAADRRDILQIIREIKDEMKDFHERLALQDQVFKMHMIKFHEEERKNK